MRINKKATGGNVLFATLFTTGLICIYLGGYLSLVKNENIFTLRSQTWNMAIPIAEAGIEEALSYMQSSFPNPLKETAIWKYNGNYLVRTNWLNANEYYVVGILPNGEKPLIISEGFSRAPLQTKFISRTVRVTTTVTTYAMPGMVVIQTASLGGNKISIDSFDSTNTLYSTLGRWDPLKRNDNGLLATLSNNPKSIDMGNSDVWGKIASGYSSATNVTPIFGPNSVVGNKAWHTSGNKGIQPGAYKADVNLDVAAVKSPITSALPLPTSTGAFKYVLGGDYRHDGTLTGNIHITGKSRLLVNGDVDLRGAILQIDAGASLELYVAAACAELGGQIINTDGRASNFKYYGLPGNKTIGAGGNGQFTAMIYAPNAMLTLNGNGGTYDFSGASLTQNVEFKGNYNFHYDESCKNEMKKGYITISWDEIKESVDAVILGNYSAKKVQELPN